LLKARTQKDVVSIAAAVKGLRQFRTFLARRTFESFTSADDLSGKVATSLHRWLIEQAVDAAKVEYRDRVERTQVPTSRTRGAATLIDFENAYWQEQVHLLSARRLVTEGEPSTIALIAGRANEDHEVLQGAALQQVNVGSIDPDGRADDYTTALAALLVGQGPVDWPIGITPGSRLVVFNVLGGGVEATTGSILAAIDAALVEGARVICVPLGGFSQSRIDADVFRRASAHGSVIVCPAGNDGGSAPVYPGGYPDCIAMAAVDRTNDLAAFSNHGDWVTAAAPGVDVPVAVTAGFQKWSGTFFACGIGAGVAALMLQANGKLRPEQVQRILREVGPSVGSGSSVPMRVIDAFAAVARASDPAAAAARPVRKRREPRKSARTPHRFRVARRR
jgi:subtilisin family serine protease